MSKISSREKAPVDIIRAETERGVSFIRHYNDIIFGDGQPEISFSICYQKTAEYGTVSCPISIDASQLTPDQRDNLRILLEVPRSRIPRSTSDYLYARYNIAPEEILAVYP